MKAIIRNITNTNRTIAYGTSRIKWIVVHYVGAISTAVNNGVYFKNAYRGVSAHYFNDQNNIVQVVEDKDIAWHSGTSGAYKHPTARNSNSLGVEMCVKRTAAGAWYFEPETIKNTQELVSDLMAKYKVPLTNVIRHYDVTGKHCPEPYVRSTTAWNTFLKGLESTTVPTVIQVGSSVKIIGTKYATGQTIPTWVKRSNHVVAKISGVNALLGSPRGINSWVRMKDLIGDSW